VASQVYKWEVILRQIVDDLDKGVMGGKKYAINLANNGLVIEFNGAYKLPEAVKKAGLDAIKGIKDGSIKVGR
jgi:basic membrane lipoprotein Med (substrate-binding protein (PBP1-ABC) superfamily)